MTMAHLLKQTKKCCVKIIRKLSFNPGATTTGGGGGGGGLDKSPTNNGHGLNNRITAKYVLHRNCTPTRCKVQPREASTAFDDPPADGWFEEEAAQTQTQAEAEAVVVFRRASSPAATRAIPETQNNYRQSRDAKNLPKKRTNINSNKNVNLRKCFRLRSKTFEDGRGQALGGETPVLATTGATEAGEGVGQVAALAEGTVDSSTLASNNSSSRLIGAKLDKISKSLMRGDVGGEGPGVALGKPLFLSRAKKCGRRSRYNHIDSEGADDDEDDEMVATGDGAEMELNFREEAARNRTQAETTLTEEGPPAAGAPSVLERLTVAETAAALLFEKVKYDRTKRYLIDQLTDAESAGQGLDPASSRHSSSCSSSPFHLAMAAAVVASKSEDFIDPWQNYNIRGGTGWDKVSKSPWDSSSSAKASPARLSIGPEGQTPLALAQQPPATAAYPARSHWNPFEYSPAHLSRLQSQPASPHRSPQRSPQRRPQPQYRPAFQVQTDVWENLNNKHYEIDTDVVWRSTRCSSRRTSASTVETWIDDEAFDNSFNEELERRCTSLKICE